MPDTDDADSQDLDALDSESLPSEPDDIGKWFESYEYESPVLDSADGIQDEFAHNGSAHVEEPDDIGKWFETYAYESPVLDSADGILDAYDLERSNLNDKVSEPKAKSCAPTSLITQTSAHNREHVDINRDNNELNSVTVKDQTQDLLPKVPDTLPLTVSNGDACNRNFDRSTGKENREPELSESGFSSTRKEKHGRISITVHSESDASQLKHGFDYGNKGSRSRKLLSDASNLNLPAIPIINRNDGKWYCPRKRKPELGPPLKQLRLQQWLRRL